MSVFTSEWPRKARPFVFYVGLVSQADTKTMQGNPTLAAGDATVSKDGAAFANLATLPAVTPAAGAAVKISLSSTEMNADNVTVLLEDAAGSEWASLLVNLQPLPTDIQLDAEINEYVTAGSGDETITLLDISPGVNLDVSAPIAKARRILYNSEYWDHVDESGSTWRYRRVIR